MSRNFYRATACNATHGIAKAFLFVRPSVSLSVRLSNACIVTKRKKLVPTSLNHIKDRSSSFSDKKNGWWVRLIT